MIYRKGRMSNASTLILEGFVTLERKNDLNNAIEKVVNKTHYK